MNFVTSVHLSFLKDQDGKTNHRSYQVRGIFPSWTLSICFRFSEDIIDVASSCKNNMFSLLKAVYLSFRYGVDGPFRRRQNELCITGAFDRYPMKDQLDR